MEPIQHDDPVSVVSARTNARTDARTNARIEARLVADRTDAEARVADLDAAIAAVVRATDGANSDDEHDPEGATIAFERAQAQALKGVTQAHLDQIAGALARLAEGSYGSCVDCGAEVGAARLEARPAAATCLTCAAKG
jgi:DnaK suppressor protein